MHLMDVVLVPTMQMQTKMKTQMQMQMQMQMKMQMQIHMKILKQNPIQMEMMLNPSQRNIHNSQSWPYLWHTCQAAELRKIQTEWVNHHHLTHKTARGPRYFTAQKVASGKRCSIYLYRSIRMRYKSS